MPSNTEQQNARDFRRSKKSGGLLTKLGTGKVGRYGKAAMLTAGMLAPSGPSGSSAFTEQDQINKAMQMQNQSATTQQYQAQQQGAGMSFVDPGTQAPTNSVNFSDLKGPEGSYKDRDRTQLDPAQAARANRDNPAFKHLDDQEQSTQSSGVTAGDEAAMRRRLDQDKLQDRNNRDASENKEQGKTSEITDQKDDKSLRGAWQKIKNEKKNASEKVKRLSAKTKMGGAVSEQASAVANRIIKQAWNQGHLILEEALLDIFYLSMLFALPYLLICGLRWFVATVGWLYIKIRGINVNLVPQFALNEIGTRIGMNAVFLLISTIEWTLIAVLIWVVLHPIKAAWELAWYTSPGGLIEIIWSLL